MSDSVQSDALVFFGATGDLAYKKIFPALQSMIRRGKIDVPIIGVAKSGWTLDQFRARARDSVGEHGGIDEAAFAKLSQLLRYVDGDYGDPATFNALRKELDGAAHPAHYLAIPPVLFGTVVEQLAKAGCTNGARVIVEKPFGHDLASAQKLTPSCTACSTRRTSSVSTTTSASGRCTTCCSSASPTPSSSRCGTAST
jgi:glucose-6-phosphate 1-dehydrogenase